MQELHVHHIFVQRAFPSLQFDIENGIVLSKKIHEAFHAHYGHFRVVTIDHFIDFLDCFLQKSDFYRKIFENEKEIDNTMLISNQESCCDSGSETNEILPNCEKIRQNMIQLKKILFFKLSPIEQEIARVSRSKVVSMKNFSNEKFQKDWLDSETT